MLGEAMDKSLVSLFDSHCSCLYTTM